LEYVAGACPRAAAAQRWRTPRRELPQHTELCGFLNIFVRCEIKNFGFFRASIADSLLFLFIFQKR